MSNIYLVGLSGSGKTSVGKKLSKKLKLDFLDTDEFISFKTKLSPKEYIEKYGEEKFRLEEKEVINHIVKKEKRFLVSTGGGLPCFHANMNTLLETGLVIYLKIIPETSFRRIKKDQSRPLSKNLKAVENIYDKRKIFYEKADLQIDGSQKIDLIVKEIEKKVKKIIKREKG